MAAARVHCIYLGEIVVSLLHNTLSIVEGAICADMLTGRMNNAGAIASTGRAERGAHPIHWPAWDSQERVGA